jgi:DNA recombination protein RmuC
MTTILVMVLVVLNIAIGLLVAYLAWKIINKIAAFTQIDVAAAVREEMRTGREESAGSAKALRDEVDQAQEKARLLLGQGLNMLIGRLKEQREEVVKIMGTIADTSRKDATSLRDEIAKTQKASNDSLVETISKMAESQKTALDDVIKGMNQIIERNKNEIATLREEVKKTQKEVNDSLVALVTNLGKTQKEGLDEITKASNALREKLEAQFKEIQKSNEQKLEEMRKTVDEKLHATLEKRLGESFKIVTDKLEAVHRGLGEMQNLATGVGNLQRVLTNVKARGTWGEIQLEAILEQILTPDQYAKNIQTKENSRERVEFAIRLPGKNGDGEQPVWLPIDSKFPKEDYERLVDASATSNIEATKQAVDALISGIYKCAKDINDKHVNPPMTTDFAIMFLPTEGLYAEVLRQPGLHDKLQRECRVLVAGPTTLAAVLNSLRMGFHTLAIEKRSSEVWRILGAVKTEFGKFGDIINKVKDQLATAANTLDATQVRTRVMSRKLNAVSALPQTEAAKLLQLGENSQDVEDETSGN